MRKKIFYTVHDDIAVHVLPNIIAFIILMVFSAATLSRNGVYFTATGLWADAIEKSPAKARPHYNLGRLYRDRGRNSEALKEYLAAARLDPADPVTHYNIGNTLLMLGRAAESIRAYEVALRLRPGYPDALYNFEVALRIEADKAAAGRDRVREAATRNDLGNLFFMKGRPDDARREYEAAIRLVPAFAEAHYNLGKAFRAQGLPDKAAEEYKVVARLKPDDADPHYNLGNIYFSKGLLAEARIKYAAALRLRPGFNDARKNLNVVNEAIKSKNLARKGRQ